jgi:hypothetical protein
LHLSTSSNATFPNFSSPIRFLFLPLFSFPLCAAPIYYIRGYCTSIGNPLYH